MSSDEYPIELLKIRRIWVFTPLMQIIAVCLLYISTTLLFSRSFHLNGNMLGGPPDVWILFVPITEEILFRGFILGALEKAYGGIWAIVISSILFGLWHLKNTFWMTNGDLEYQMFYTAFIFGPITAAMTLKLRSIWPGVILHYLNNFPTELIPPLGGWW
ncbi:CPBP family intramembrane glutamic endopeptidase [Novosphingobium terrae]|uniref:CPBP family intramembrane glutamic endopeptidase n=1 Tax=Novosphingobium terrae TaxID=2726189 RepID=UPI00197CCA97|nr:CPBP family intramembrane glutamic endopeptidase [Novosphingobium terrae]